MAVLIQLIILIFKIIVHNKNFELKVKFFKLDQKVFQFTIKQKNDFSKI